MKKSKQSDLWYFITQSLISLVYVGLGIFLITRSNFVWRALYIVFVFLLLSSAVLYLYRSIRYHKRADLFMVLGIVISLVVFQGNEFLYVEMVAAIFGIWALFNAFVHGLQIYVAFKEGNKRSLYSYAIFIFDFVMGFLLIFNGLANRNIINYQVGTYVIVFGIVQFISALRVMLDGSSSIRMSSPVLLSALLPPFVVDRVPKNKEKHPDSFRKEVEMTRGNFVSVYVHIRNEGYNRLGHVDIGYNGAIYSYGAHDPFKRAFSSIYGAGVMIVGGEKDFVRFAVDSDSSVYRFKIRLSDEQTGLIEESIDKLFTDTYVYDFPHWDDLEGEHYLTRLKHFSPSMTYYKFDKEPFKTYNLFTTNCVLIADSILQSTGMKLFQMSGVITPGAYYAFLENLASAQDSIVVEKTTYSNKE